MGQRPGGIIRRPNPYLPGWQINASISVPSHKILVRFSLRAVPRPRLDVLPPRRKPHQQSGVTLHSMGVRMAADSNDPAATGTPTLTSQTADIKRQANLF